MPITKTGIIEKTIQKIHEEARIEWKISDFITVVEVDDACDGYDSPAFFINDISWFLRLFPRSTLNPEFMRLFIVADEKKDYSVEYNVGLKKSDGSVQKLVSGIRKNSDLDSGVGNIIKRSELLQQKSELIYQNAISIICTLKYEIAHSTQPGASDLTRPFTLISKLLFFLIYVNP